VAGLILLLNNIHNKNRFGIILPIIFLSISFIIRPEALLGAVLVLYPLYMLKVEINRKSIKEILVTLITILSLLSDAKLILTYGTKRENILLPSRSVIQLKGIYRTHWKHSIEKIEHKRISVVFRQLGKTN
jgi:hypothetical protein